MTTLSWIALALWPLGLALIWIGGYISEGAAVFGGFWYRAGEMIQQIGYAGMVVGAPSLLIYGAVQDG